MTSKASRTFLVIIRFYFWLYEVAPPPLPEPKSCQFGAKRQCVPLTSTHTHTQHSIATTEFAQFDRTVWFRSYCMRRSGMRTHRYMGCSTDNHLSLSHSPLSPQFRTCISAFSKHFICILTTPHGLLPLIFEFITTFGCAVPATRTKHFPQTCVLSCGNDFATIGKYAECHCARTANIRIGRSVCVGEHRGASSQRLISMQVLGRARGSKLCKRTFSFLFRYILIFGARVANFLASEILNVLDVVGNRTRPDTRSPHTSIQTHFCTKYANKNKLMCIHECIAYILYGRAPP